MLHRRVPVTALVDIPSAVDPCAGVGGAWPPVKVERPTGRTTLTGGRASPRLLPGRWGRASRSQSAPRRWLALVLGTAEVEGVAARPQPAAAGATVQTTTDIRHSPDLFATASEPDAAIKNTVTAAGIAGHTLRNRNPKMRDTLKNLD